VVPVVPVPQEFDATLAELATEVDRYHNRYRYHLVSGMALTEVSSDRHAVIDSEQGANVMRGERDYFSEKEAP
jgi:hypothetical protein